MSYLLSKSVGRVCNSELHVTIRDYRTYLAGKDFGVSLITASKMCRAQLCQKKVFSALLISHLEKASHCLQAQKVSLGSSQSLTLLSKKIYIILGVTSCTVLAFWMQSQTRQVGTEEKEPTKHKKKGVAQSIDNWLSTLRCCIK